MLTRLLTFGAIAAALAATLWYLTRPEPLAVALHTVARGTVEETVANTRAGTVKACRRARLSPASGGQVAELTVHEGDRVKAGQLLLALWNEDLAAEVKLAGSQADAARAQAEETCLRADVAQREARRLVRLQDQNLVSEDQVDRAVTNASASAAACRAARAAASVAENRILAARAALERTRLHAPFDGIVAEVNGELGEYVTPSPPGIPTPPAVDLIDDACLYVTAPIDEVDAPRMRVGQDARVSLDAFPERALKGHVRRIAPYVLDLEKQARTVEVEVILDDPREAADLLAGYSADVEVVISRHPDVLWVPSEAVREDDTVLVFVPAEAAQTKDEETGTLEARAIEKGLANWDTTEVKGGLEAGERVVTSVGREGAEAGALVSPE